MNLKKELTSLQHRDSRMKAEYDRRIREMMEVELSRSSRTGWLVSAGISFFATAQWIFVTWVTWRQVHWPAHTAFIALAVGCLLWALLSVSIARRGRIIRRAHIPWGVGIITMLAYVLFIMSFFQVPYTADSGTRMMVLFCGLAVLLAAGVVIVLYRMEQNSVKVQEELLRLQLQLADLSQTRS